MLKEIKKIFTLKRIPKADNNVFNSSSPSTLEEQ